MKIALVYQAGIANVFQVERFGLSESRRIATTRMLQGAFSQCEWFARGLRAGGADVQSFGCNQAGDIRFANWVDELSELPFSDQFAPVRS